MGRKQKIKTRILIEFLDGMDADPKILSVAPTAEEASNLEAIVRAALARHKGFLLGSTFSRRYD